MKEETPKQKAIREAWGYRYDQWKDEINENGWLEIYSYNSFLSKTYIDRTSMFNGCLEGWQRKHEFRGELISIRPIILKGISSNNGWIRTDEQMPDEGKPIVYIDRYGHQRNGFLADTVFVSDTGWREDVETPTHWRPKEVYPKPIY